ncbi:MAG: hypothetical protein WHV66_11900 [Anaerolineales bacterium]|jgi:uncharacterized membrane protein
MFQLTVPEFMMTMAACLFVMGVLCILSGVFILVSKVMMGELRSVTRQVAHLAQKGIADDLSGLVGNTSALLEALTQLVRTASGVGMFLVMVGFLLVACSFYLVNQIK